MAHLQVPNDLDVIGVTIPGAPGIILGNNQDIAWGATNLAPDVQDLYLEELYPRDRSRYRVGNSWETLEERNETLMIRGAQPEFVKVRSTRHGPVLQDLGAHLPVLRWTLLDNEEAYPHANQQTV